MSYTDKVMLKVLLLALCIAFYSFMAGVHSFDGVPDPTRNINVVVSSTVTERG